MDLCFIYLFFFQNHLDLCFKASTFIIRCLKICSVYVCMFHVCVCVCVCVFHMRPLTTELSNLRKQAGKDGRDGGGFHRF